MSKQAMKTWNVRVHRSGGSVELGQVHETTEALARCAALSRFGISDDEVSEDQRRAGIHPADDFDVSPA